MWLLLSVGLFQMFGRQIWNTIFVFQDQEKNKTTETGFWRLLTMFRRQRKWRNGCGRRQREAEDGEAGGNAPEAFDLPACVQERHEDPNGRSLCAARSPSRDGKQLSMGSAQEKEAKFKRPCLAKGKVLPILNKNTTVKLTALWIVLISDSPNLTGRILLNWNLLL